MLDSAAASALDSEDTELSEEMVWDWKTVSSQHHSQFQLWKLWNLQIFHTFPYISILFYASHGKIWKGLRTFRRFGRPLVAFQSCMAGAEHAGSRGGAKRWCPAKLRFRRH